MTVFVTVNRR